MRALFFTIMIASSVVLEIILINMSKDITVKTPQIISIFLMSLSLLSTFSTFIIWLLNPFQVSSKIKIITILFDLIIKIISLAIFTIFYYTGNYVSGTYVSTYYLIFSFSFSLCCGFGKYNITPPQDRSYIDSPLETPGIPIIKNIIFTSNEPSSCAICIEEFQEGENINETNCNHKFHLQCMERLLKNKFKLCPLCRDNLYGSDIIV